MSTWSPTSWRALPILQQPVYLDSTKLHSVLDNIAQLPPLVSVSEVQQFKAHLQQVARGERFILQGGDCAERFLDCTAEAIESKIKILLQMALCVSRGAHIKTMQIARMAGQYAKPRSKDTEILSDGREVMSFRGDNINGFDANDREPDPNRLLLSYFHSASTLNHVRTLYRQGFTNIENITQWSVDFDDASAVRKNDYERLIRTIALPQSSDMTPMHTGPTSMSSSDQSFSDIFTSHEGLLLEYETALTRADPVSKSIYNLGAHFLWIGDRTRQIGGAHVEYFRGIANPIGLKIGCSLSGDELVALCRVLNPANEIGKLVLITRLGAEHVEQHLPVLIRAVQEAQLEVIWVCDPMHGNTHSVNVDGCSMKTRSFGAILQEILLSFRVHSQFGTRLGGVHCELTGEHVTECMGGPENLSALDLPLNYTTQCDPRLNHRQSIEMAFQLAAAIRENQH